MSIEFGSESIYSRVGQDPKINIEKLGKIDSFCRRLPDISDYVLVKQGPYEIMKKVLVNYVNIFQRLRGREEFGHVDDLQLTAMHLCKSYYFEELPDIVFTQRL